MTDLDTKLREILLLMDRGVTEIGSSEGVLNRLIAQIKQAFEEAGYYQLGNFDTDSEGINKAKTVIRQANLLSGAEWLELFEKEWKKEISKGYPMGYIGQLDMMFAAAKRASGVKE